jgi:type VI secretion system protein ImpL
MRSSGKPLSDGIPGFLTTDGFHKVLLPSLDGAVKGVVSESWVLGSRVAFDPNGPQVPALEREVIGLYEKDYAQAWDQMLADLNPVQLRSLPQAAQDLYILAASDSPMHSLLASIAGQLTLSAVPADTQSGNAQAGATNDTQARLQAILGSVQSSTNAPLPPGHEIDERYQALREFVGTRPGAPIDSVLREIGDVQQVVAKLAATLVSTSTAAPASGALDPLQTLKVDAAHLPEPVERWLNQIATSVIALRSGDPRLQLATIYNAPGGPAEICPAVVNGHYPFVATSADDVSIADFARLFAPGAALDGFANTLLGRYVDTSAKTWRLISADAASSPVSAADVTQFQRATTIRDTYFADGETRPHFRLSITPVSADAATRRATLDLDGTAIVYTTGAQRATQLMWPTFSLQPTMRLVFDPPVAGGEALQATGPWALFRLFERGRMQPQPATPDHYTLTFQLGARQAVFDLRVPGGNNPLALGLLQDFHCPSVRAN